MQKLKPLQDALAAGLRKGALIHEASGAAHPVEVIAAEDERLIAVARGLEDDLQRFRADARVRVELPREASVVYVPGRIRDIRTAGDSTELELACPDGAEDRQRRMDVRIDAECRIRLGADEDWEETRTVNISVGGALVVSDSRAKVSETVDVELELAGQPIRCRAQVLRRGVKANGAPSRTSAALKFVGMPEDIREAIALYVLRAQAGENRRHGK